MEKEFERTEQFRAVCTHCGSTNSRKNGRYQGSQRYQCRDCKRAFSDKVRKFAYTDKEKFLDMYLNNVGIRKAARSMGCAHTLLLRWIKELAANLKQRAQKSVEKIGESLPDVIEMDEIYAKVKKKEISFPYGLLILGDEVRLLRL